MSIGEFIGDWHALFVLLVAGFLPNEIWRVLGLWIGGGLDENSEILVWVRATATAVIAGVIMQILIIPPGALANVPVAIRFGAMAVGFVAYVAARRSVAVGVVCGEIFVLAGTYLAK
jgi:hypothetical protein